MTHKILIIHDVHVDTPQGRIMWAYGRRSAALQRYAPDDFHVDICQTSEALSQPLDTYDLIFQLEYCNPNPSRFRDKGFKGVWCVSYNSDARRRQHYWANCYPHVDWLVCNNLEVFDAHGRMPKTCCISNGVDTEIFQPTVPIAERPHKCIFAGSTGVTKMKGWDVVFHPLEERLPELGFETDFRPIDDIKPEFVKPTQETVEWYNSASYVLCASMSEGTPNLVSEAVACGCVAVTVPVGNCLEWGQHGENCVLTDRNADSFIEALLYARENRERLSAAGMKTIREGWSYGPPGDRALWYMQLFRRLIQDGAKSISPFAYHEKHWSEI